MPPIRSLCLSLRDAGLPMQTDVSPDFWANLSAEARLRRWHPRGVLCAICRRPAAGFGWLGPQQTKHSGPDVWFCSMSCQTFFHDRARKVPDMVDLTPLENAAIEAGIEPVARMIDGIGWHVPPAAWTRDQMLGLILAGIEGFQESMRVAAVQPAQVTASDCPF